VSRATRVPVPVPTIGRSGRYGRRMTRSCARPGCGEPACATLGYDYANRTVDLEPLAAEAHPSYYDVCRRHSDNLVVPRGWRLLDTRHGTVALAGHLSAS
jgi:hypothetical protein